MWNFIKNIIKLYYLIWHPKIKVMSVLITNKIVLTLCFIWEQPKIDDHVNGSIISILLTL